MATGARTSGHARSIPPWSAAGARWPRLSDSRTRSPARKPFCGASSMTRSDTADAVARPGAALAIPFLALALHLGLAHRYGYNGDELYFLACGRRLAFGYVDHAPL